ncbi:MAG: DUF6232 family protein [Nostoc sp.]|uniref:DUF6232 family protein n=1 Tax=Nostoc sp. TaxID=1180 RepID=UPI002FF69E3F
MSTLSITNRTLKLGSTVYQVSNVTSVSKYRIQPRYTFNIRFIIICGLLSWLGVELVKRNPDMLVLNWVIVILFSFVVLGILERFIRPKKYGLSIITNSGGVQLIASTNQKLIDKIIDKLIEIMNNRDAPANYTFNVSDGDIINQSGLFENGVKVG